MTQMRAHQEKNFFVNQNTSFSQFYKVFHRQFATLTLINYTREVNIPYMVYMQSETDNDEEKDNCNDDGSCK